MTIEGPNQVEGYPDGDALVARYAERSERDVGDLDFYVAFARWRAACIQAGVYSRYEAGALGEGEGERPGPASRASTSRRRPPTTRWPGRSQAGGGEEPDGHRLVAA